MKEYNETINEILANEIDTEILKVIDKKKKELGRQEKIERDKRYLMQKIARQCWKVTKGYCISKHDSIEYKTKDYSVVIDRDSFRLWLRNGKIDTGFEEGNPLFIYYYTERLVDSYVDLLHLDLVKQYFEEIIFDLANKTREELSKLEYENDKQKSFLKMIIEKVSNW